MTVADDEEISCPLPDCGVGRGGRCLEGVNDPRGCSRRRIALHALDEGAHDAENAEAPGDLMAEDTPGVTEFDFLPSGEALNLDGANELIARTSCNIVAVIGESDCGKTTIVSNFYLPFHEGPFSKYMFAGSKTLLGFERRCHESRTASGRSDPTTLHTSGDLHFLHLKLRAADGSLRNLLFADRPGEHFRNARNHGAIARSMTELRHAHVILLLLNGEQLAAPSQRSRCVETAVATIRALVEAGSIIRSTQICPVVTKADLIDQATASEAALKCVERLRGALGALELGTSSPIITAAQPKTDGSPYEPGYGMSNLLEMCLAPSILRQECLEIVLPPARSFFEALQPGQL